MTKRIEFSESVSKELDGKLFNSTVSEVKKANGKKGKLKNGLFYEVMRNSIIIF